MAFPFKSVLAIGGLSLIITAGILTAKGIGFMRNEGEKSDEKKINWKPLTVKSEYPYANSFSIFLVNPNENEDWWKESYELLKNNKNSKYGFKDVTSSYGSDNKSLNNLCETIYNSYLWDFSIDDASSKENKYDWRDIFKYCSPLRGLPTKISSNSYAEGTIGGFEYIQGPWLIDIHNNEEFWDIANKIFEMQTAFLESEIFFRSRQSIKSLRDICEEAYNKPLNSQESTKDNPKTSEVFAYCRWSRFNTSNQLKRS